MPFCPNCGKELPEKMNFCNECGTPLKESSKPPIERTQPRTRPRERKARSDISNVEMNVRRRRKTDSVMSFAKWFLLSIITFGIAGIVALYKLIKRRNEHFKRQWRLMESIESVLQSISESKKVDISPQLRIMADVRRDSVDDEGKKSAGLWVILSIITGIAGLYVLYFLTTDIHKHYRKQRYFVRSLSKAMDTLRISDPNMLGRVLDRQYEVPKRSFAIYLILSIITFGLFSIYWVYVIFKDYNEHFKSQWALEDEIVESLRA